MVSYLKSLPVQLIVSILAAFLIGQSVDSTMVRFFYTGSTWFVEILLFILPFMVFSFIFRAIVSIERGSTLLVLLILGGVTLSNFIALLTAYGFSKITLSMVGICQAPHFADKFTSTITPLFNFELPKFIGTDKAMLLGLVLALGANFLRHENPFKRYAQRLSVYMSDAITVFLQKIFIPLLPFYVFGFCLKLSYDNALIHLFKDYGQVFILSMLLVVLYILTLYLLAAGFNLKRCLQTLKIMTPAGLTGFSTMSSAATMPVTLTCTEQTTKDRNFTDLIIPSTANIHMLGDDLTIVMTSMALLTLCGHQVPSFGQFLFFTGAFCIAKLSCVGIPGASVLVVLPVLQHFLGFSPEMISILTTIYILQDPFGTAANVMGNGAFALLIQRAFNRLRLRKS